MSMEFRQYKSKVIFETPNDHTLPKSYENLINPVVKAINSSMGKPVPMYIKGDEIIENNGVMERHQLHWGDATIGVSPRVTFEYQRERANQHRITLTGAPSDITDKLRSTVFDVCEDFFSQN